MKDRDRHDRIALLLDAELDAEERRPLMDLVARDPEARRCLEEYRALWALLDGYPGVTARECVGAGLVARAETERRRARRRGLVHIGVSWAAAAALFLAVFLGLPAQRASDPDPSAVATELTETYSRYAASLYDFEDF
ncbi:MAG: hypothetical protein JXQ29_17980 [Planctomycetes bacterium]|nr:hypothetical protein [Planctomycetota bacterium]